MGFGWAVSGELMVVYKQGGLPVNLGSGMASGGAAGMGQGMIKESIFKKKCFEERGEKDNTYTQIPALMFEYIEIS